MLSLGSAGFGADLREQDMCDFRPNRWFFEDAVVAAGSQKNGHSGAPTCLGRFESGVRGGGIYDTGLIPCFFGESAVVGGS